MDMKYIQRSWITQSLGHLRLATGQRAEVQFLELFSGQGDRGRNLRELRHGRAIVARSVDSQVVVHCVYAPIRTGLERM